MDKVKEVTSPEPTKNDLKSSEYIKRDEEKKDKNSGKKFLETFLNVNKKNDKKQQEGNWYKDNYDTTNNISSNAKQEYTDSNNVSVAARNVMFSRIRVNTEIKVLQDENKQKSKKELETKRNKGEAR